MAPEIFGRLALGNRNGKQRLSKSNHSEGKPLPIYKLLALPDDILIALFAHLSTTKTNRPLMEPRHAFRLAMTNSKLLRIFCGLLTHVTTLSIFMTPPFVLLSPAFLRVVSAVSGFALRNLHLGTLGCGDFVQLHNHCPQLESFSFVDCGICHCDGCISTLQNLLRLPLRSLSIAYPSPRTLCLVSNPPPELSFRQCREESFEEVIRIISDPPKQLDLEIYHVVVPPDLSALISTLLDVCPRIEKLRLSQLTHELFEVEGPARFGEVAETLISSARKNSDKSVCTSIKVTGEAFFRLLERVHPDASIEMSSFFLSFIDTGDGIFPRKLLLLTQYLNVDVSRLEEVFFGSGCNLEWKSLLKDLKLKRAFVRDTSVAAYLCLDVEIVDLEYGMLEDSEWGWLDGVQEIHLQEPLSLPIMTKEFLEAFAQMIDVFRGDVVRLDRWYHFKFYCPVIIGDISHELQELLSAVNRFEERGGDGEIIRDMIRYIESHVSS